MSDEANNTLSELKNELKGAVNSRLRSPVAGLFALSWLLINHRVLFVLFSDLKVGKRFDYIDDEIYGAPGVWVSRNILLPLGSTAFFLLVMPWVSAMVHRWNLWHQRRLKELELRSEGLQLLTKEQGQEIRRSIVRRDAMNEKLLSDLKRLKSTEATLRCSHAVYSGADVDRAAAYFSAYLMLHTFEVEVDSAQTVLRKHSFDEEGSMSTEWRGGRPEEEPEKWRLDGYSILLITGSDRLFQKFDFNPLHGHFEGRFNGRVVFLRPSIR
ncbi:hypothetical protein SE336_15855 [Xanthomonas arboricola]|uniref:hypothetical protein n=1 Tax=Xanthomonas arboricola TaxID=56448 RepID=UPI0039F45073